MQRSTFIRSALAVALAGTGAVIGGAGPALAATDTGSLSGAVRDTRGAIVADAGISVYADDNQAGDAVARTTTDSAGRWRIPALEAGRYKVQIGLGGWSDWAPGQRSQETATSYAVAAGRGTRANSIVTAAGIISGRLVTANGSPAANVRVVADNYENARFWETTTSATGRYTLKVQPGTDYTVKFIDGYLRQYAPHTTDSEQARHFPVASGRTVRVNDRLLTAATLTGRLTDAAGAPVAGASVRFLTETAFELQTTTDADGRYQFDKLSPWRVKVAFRAADEDAVEQWAYQKLSYDEADEVALSLGTVTTVDNVLLP
ncbi:carboxypeptidase-like regulatory domain-containing protein [Actinoplanes bogorensis]|uniref:Carboxypeptidase-like regulatory domain-containing protein n=1 Tax=Paractinoplanes bogorensis TaxID=1610840 RepID=A0ABS5YFW6_9ACTN|nr:carboxypeptidase-like regulatory domain-containing protein [Actinoplanes bogorensis]MBU2662330.1 carboxypeptidase-like regulatory domain-containing protein [Actinoplanes bogorensis]